MKHYLFIGLGGNHLNIEESHYTKDPIRFKNINDKWLSDSAWKIWACDPKHYSDEDLKKIKQSNWIDHFLQKDICDDWKDVPLFDEWDCTSVLEHVKKEDSERFFEGLVKKIKADSVGHIYVDMTDHATQSNKMFSDLSYASQYYDYRDKKYEMYLNRIEKEEWLNIIDRHFTYDVGHVNRALKFRLINIKVKK